MKSMRLWELAFLFARETRWMLEFSRELNIYKGPQIFVHLSNAWQIKSKIKTKTKNNNTQDQESMMNQLLIKYIIKK